MYSRNTFDAADPQWLAHRYEPGRDQLLYRFVPRAMHADGPFLTDELVGAQPSHVADRAAGVAAARAHAAPLHFIFHSAFCASTLLVRALDRPGVAMGLSEPVLLNDVTGIRRRGERTGADLARLLDEAMALLARPWGAGESVVVKPSNILCALQRPMLALRPDARAVLLHAPLRVFLTSVARKGLWCRLWVRELLEGLLRDGLVDLGFAPDDFFRMSDLQVAAVGWLAQHRQFAMLVQQFPDRVRTLDSERLMADPAAAIGRAAALFGLPADGVGEHAAMARHSKTGAAFTPSDRAREHADAMAAHRDEIEKVKAWALVIAERSGIALDLKAPLLP
ncbi:hypothetical protein [Sphingomonas dokdonensis]|uniref:Sulfotransferase family protein n=1 Tax=Sphingomonas dokdonensis TaxID=344880 RepID=A0A245ZKN1_9SPHN|nr:hypothetical protein [Sphingomonas dokdonensis]OWK30308.1 hypothetical protein SPDO_19930 [Sphingomonas dokdonensis]